MSRERPTACTIISRHSVGLRPYERAQAIIDALAADGYRIVRPDDVPPGRMPVEPGRAYTYTPGTPTYEDGWNACRAHIFGEGT